MEYFCERVEKPSDLLLLLKYIESSSEIDDEFWADMIDRLYSHEYIIIGIYRLVNCKTCIAKTKPEMIGFIYARLYEDELDVIAFNMEAAYNSNKVIGNTIRDYITTMLSDLQMKQIKFHSKVRPKQWYDNFFGTEFQEYSTYVWRENAN